MAQHWRHSPKLGQGQTLYVRTMHAERLSLLKTKSNLELVKP